MFFKIVVDGYVIGLGYNKNKKNGITQQEYEALTAILNDRPKAPDEYHEYMLKDVVYEWELVEIPHEPELL